MPLDEVIPEQGHAIGESLRHCLQRHAEWYDSVRLTMNASSSSEPAHQQPTPMNSRSGLSRLREQAIKRELSYEHPTAPSRMSLSARSGGRRILLGDRTLFRLPLNAVDARLLGQKVNVAGCGNGRPFYLAMPHGSEAQGPH